MNVDIVDETKTKCMPVLPVDVHELWGHGQSTVLISYMVISL